MIFSLISVIDVWLSKKKTCFLHHLVAKRKFTNTFYQAKLEIAHIYLNSPSTLYKQLTI